MYLVIAIAGSVISTFLDFYCFLLLVFSVAIVCVTILDRLESDVAEAHGDWEHRPGQLVVEYIKNHL